MTSEGVVALSRGDEPLILLSYETIVGRTVREIIARLRLEGSLGISTPVFRRLFQLSEIPTRLFPDLLIVGTANARRLPPFYLYEAPPDQAENKREIELWVHVSNKQDIEINPFLARVNLELSGKDLLKTVSDYLSEIPHVPWALTVAGKEVERINVNPNAPLTLECALTPLGMEQCEARIHAVKEFVESEAQFVRDVSDVLGFWKSQLVAEKVIEADEGTEMFRPLEAVAVAHALFLEKLEEVENTYSATIGGLFCDAAQMFKASGEYFSLASYIQARLKQKLDSPDIARRVEKISERREEPRGLMEMLQIPLKRYDLYEEFLAELGQLTPKCHTDFRLIKFAVELVQQVNVDLKLKMTSYEGMLKCIEIQRRVQFEVLAPGRAYVDEFVVKVDGQSGRLYLFTDLMLVTTDGKKTGKVTASYSIPDVRYMANQSVVHFRKYKQKEVCTVEFESPDMAQMVLTHILELKMGHYEKVGEADKVIMFTSLKASWDLPSLTRHTGAVINNSLYFFGGRNESGFSDKFVTIDPQWTTSVNICPFDTTEAAAAVVGDSVYIYGGVNAQGNYNSLYQFHSRTQNWRNINVMDPPPPRKGHTMVSYERKLYIFGGIEAGKDRPSDSMLVFDTETETWSELETENRPEGRHRHTACVWEHYMIIHGGTYGRTVLSDIRMFNFETNEWLQPRLSGWILFPRYSHCMISVNNWLLIIGGTDGWRLAPSVAIYCTPTLDFTIHPLVSGGNNSEYLINSCMLSNNAGVILYGGSDMHGTTCSSVYRLVMPPIFCEYEYATVELDNMTQGHMNLYYPSGDDPDYLERMKRLRTHGTRSCSSLCSGTRAVVPDFPACRVTPEDAGTVATLLTPLIHSQLPKTPPSHETVELDVPDGVFVPPELASGDILLELCNAAPQEHEVLQDITTLPPLESALCLPLIEDPDCPDPLDSDDFGLGPSAFSPSNFGPDQLDL